MRLEEMEKQSKDYVRDHINGCFEGAEETTDPDARAILLTEAEFWMRELEHRRDSRISFRDLVLEIFVILLIAGELGMGCWQIIREGKNFKEEEGVFKGMQTSMNETVTSIGLLNAKMQNQLDLFYEPSVYLTFSRDKGANNLELHNNGRTNVTVFAVAVNTNNTCILDEPLPISFGQSRQRTWEILERRTITPVLQSDGTQWMALYLRTEDGREYRTDAKLERWSQVDGVGLNVHNLGTTKVDWKREYAEKSKKLAANKKCSLKL